ncbi:MAG: glycosyltransferase family 9 protein [Pedobacter sp.]|nr:MAG: glycosyltransferase family 9 protein [Pedobacter sp.]
MGDIIYTTPVVRCLKLKFPDAEIHFLTKKEFQYIYNNNPYLTKLHLLGTSLLDTISELKTEQFDLIVDLHSNLRTSIIKMLMRIPSTTYKKDRINKWLALKFKLSRFVSSKHLVDRYLDTVKFLGVVNDGKPIDYFISGKYDLEQMLPISHRTNYVAFIIGATHFTKRMPNDRIIDICRGINQPIVLLGGKDVAHNAVLISEAIGHRIYDTCGKINLDQSVFLVSNAKKVIGFDTGLTHISEAFNKPLATIWGGTTAELLGVNPYQISESYMAQIDLSCRPCSKFGLEACPLEHFNCMKNIPLAPIVDFVNS